VRHDEQQSRCSRGLTWRAHGLHAHRRQREIVVVARHARAVHQRVNISGVCVWVDRGAGRWIQGVCVSRHITLAHARLQWMLVCCRCRCCAHLTTVRHSVQRCERVCQRCLACSVYTYLGRGLVLLAPSATRRKTPRCRQSLDRTENLALHRHVTRNCCTKQTATRAFLHRTAHLKVLDPEHGQRLTHTV
jgi:hypothetical protein